MPETKPPTPDKNQLEERRKAVADKLTTLLEAEKAQLVSVLDINNIAGIRPATVIVLNEELDEPTKPSQPAPGNPENPTVGTPPGQDGAGSPSTPATPTTPDGADTTVSKVNE